MRVAVALAMGALLVIGCLGQAERDFFDDSGGEGGGPDARTEGGDVIVPPGEGGNDGGNDSGDSGDSSTPDAGPTHAVGGIVIGLTGTGLVLQLNGGGDEVVQPQGGANRTFTFGPKVAEGAGYTVTVKTQPSSPVQDCKVIGGGGVIGQNDITSVVINCLTNQYVVGGTLTGLEGSITLHNTVTDDGGAVGAGEDQLRTSSGQFVFIAPLNAGQGYSVSVTDHSALPEQLCTITKGSGTIVNQNISDVAVSCATSAYAVGGTVTGLTSGTVELSSTNGGTVSRTADGTFTLPTPVLSNRTYNVTVSSQPATRTCYVTNASGTVTTAPIANVTVTCFPKFAFVEAFDGVTAPALPAGWTTAILTGTGNPDPFATTSVASGTLGAFDTTPNSCAVPGHVNISDVVLTSPSFTVSSAFAKLSFRHAYVLESGTAAAGHVAYDGAVLEISTNDGTTWADIITAGGTWDPPWKDGAGVVNANYTGYSYVGDTARIISNGFQNPLPGRHAWTGTSGGYKLTTVRLPLAAGASARVRFRLATDKQVNSPGWRIDTVSIAN